MGEFEASTVAVRAHLQKMIGAISAADPDWLKFAKWHEVKGCAEAMVLSKSIGEMDARRYGTLCQRKIAELRPGLNKSIARF
jgi:hypothetical protein